MLNENVSAADGFAWSWGNNGSTTTVTDDIPDMTVPQQKAAGYQASQFALLSIKDQVIYQHVTAYLELILQQPPAATAAGGFSNRLPVGYELLRRGSEQPAAVVWLHVTSPGFRQSSGGEGGVGGLALGALFRPDAKGRFDRAGPGEQELAVVDQPVRLDVVDDRGVGFWPRRITSPSSGTRARSTPQPRARRAWASRWWISPWTGTAKRGRTSSYMRVRSPRAGWPETWTGASDGVDDADAHLGQQLVDRRDRVLIARNGAGGEDHGVAGLKRQRTVFGAGDLAEC